MTNREVFIKLFISELNSRRVSSYMVEKSEKTDLWDKAILDSRTVDTAYRKALYGLGYSAHEVLKMENEAWDQYYKEFIESQKEVLS